MRTVLGIFDDKGHAENAINDLKTNGYNPKDISVIMKNRDEAERIHHDTGSNVGKGAVSGATAGGVIGGIAGLLIGIGAITIPGIGGLLIGGPIASALGITGATATTAEGILTGALAGGLLGALVGLGIPKEQAEVYARKVQEGAILLAVPVRNNDEMEAMRFLEDNNAVDVKAFTLRNEYRSEVDSRRAHHTGLSS